MFTSRLPVFSSASLLALVAALAVLLFAAGCPDEGAAEEAATAQGSLAETSAPLLDAYLEIQTALAGDSTEGVAAAAGRIADAATALPQSAGLDAAHREVVGELANRIEGEARALAAASDLAGTRDAFRPLSESVLQLRPFMAAAADVVAVHCPMKEARWLQRGTDVRNPYHGSEMLGCGRIVEVAASGHDGEGHACGKHEGHDCAEHGCPMHGGEGACDGHDCPDGCPAHADHDHHGGHDRHGHH
jgi:hypothetical protein